MSKMSPATIGLLWAAPSGLLATALAIGTEMSPIVGFLWVGGISSLIFMVVWGLTTQDRGYR
jgi:hypothetical protein